MPKVSLDSKAHQYTVDGVSFASVTKILQGTGLIDLSLVRPEVLEAAGKFGMAVHLACELNDRHNLDIEKLDPHLVPYLAGWNQFRKDYQVEWTGIEQSIYSLRWHFAGTLDRAGRIKNKWTLVDIKSASTISPSTAIQLAGYQIAWEEMTHLKIKQRWCVQLLPKGYVIEDYPCHEKDKSVFLSALTVYNWKKEKKLWKL